MEPFNSILDAARYGAARNLLIRESQFLTAIALLLVIAVVFAAIRQPRQVVRQKIGMVLLFLLACEALLAWFHWQIYSAFVIINPYTGAIESRVQIPFWIESEKLFFWTLGYSVYLYMILRRDINARMVSWLAVCLSAMLILVFALMNPFANPLPQVHSELVQMTTGLQSQNHELYAQAFQEAIGRFRYYYGSTFMWLHPPLLFISYSAFLAGFIGNLLMLVSSRARDVEITSTSAIRFGYLILTAGMLIGYPWALTAWRGMPWWWSPKINVSIMMWVFYTGYLHSRLYLLRRGMWMTTAVLGLLSFAALLFTYITTYLIPGAHSYG